MVKPGIHFDDFSFARGGAPAQWLASPAPIPYGEAMARMNGRVAAIREARAPELVWLLEHPPLYTAGTSAQPGHLLHPDRLPVFHTGRGGQYTYHGPGQRVVYVMLDLQRRRPDIRAFVHALEGWLIDALAALGVCGERRADRVGVWVRRPDKGSQAEDKIAAIGIRIRRWVSFHGVALNVAPDLGHFAGIVPCGVREQGVTSLRDLGLKTTMADADAALRQAFERRFGALVTRSDSSPG